MRTIQEIKDTITTAVLANSTLRTAFDLTIQSRWESQVSNASILNLIIYIVAVAQHTLEWLFDVFKSDVEERIKAALPGSVSWLWNRAMEYQDNTAANIYFSAHGEYETVVEADQIIKYCSVVEEYNQVKIKVNKNEYAALTSTQLEQFTSYMERLKFAGVRLSVSSLVSDDLEISLNIWRDKLLLTDDAAATATISAAITDYLDNIKFAGNFNKTALIDALQKVTGVTDVTITSCLFIAHDTDSTTTQLSASEQNYRSIAGHINLSNLVLNYE